MPPPRSVVPVPLDKDLARLSATPFSLKIETTPLPAGFHQPKFTVYDGKTDPYIHVSHFRHVMARYKRNDALMCLIFPSSLGELGLKWFERLSEESIKKWQQLAETFVTRFKTNTKTPKEVDHLLSVKMEFSDSLKAYNSRYWETFNEILDCPNNLVITQYKHGLPVGHRLRDSLMMNQPISMELLMQRINEHIRVEDDATASITKTNPVVTDKRVAGKVHAVGQETNRPNDRARKSDHGPDHRNRGKGRCNDQADYPRDNAADANRKLNAQTGITKVFKIPIYRILSEIYNEVYVQFPAKLGNAQKGFNPQYRCTFHRERGHRTEDCLPLKQHLEELVIAGHLNRYIDEGVRAVHHAPAEPSGLDDLEAPPQGVVNVIHGIVEPARPEIKRGKTEEKNVVNFSSRDLERIQTPHNDALVVTLRVKDFDVKHILIDQGSLVEIIYYNAFKQLKLRDTDLAPATSSLVGFNSQPEWPTGKIILLVKVGSVVKQVEF
ncbi:uncharacterized protein LOC114307433 [Camellia sinensis]|uniref:uncharacterized protein LOC114307433 n=1 Tax=Camellia sinensis TaxID=4442 RepID=UPI00103689B9|nr:uncharacterized protein LOC114307433 [Camellia sinensis]